MSATRSDRTNARSGASNRQARPSAGDSPQSSSAPVASGRSSGGGDGTTSADNSGANNKLVFGLSSRANRVKYDEYAEQRLKTRKSQSPPQPSGPVRIEESQGHRVAASGPKGGDAHPSQQRVTADRESSRRERARRKLQPSTHQHQHQARPQQQEPSDIAPDKIPSAEVVSGGSGKVVTSGSSTVSVAASVRARSKSPDERSSVVRMARRKSLEEDLSAIKIESSRPRTRPSGTHHPQQQPQDHQLQQITSSELEPQRPQTRTQFNITPPPQVSIAGASKGGSMVGFAKARIYDKPAKKILPATNPPAPSPLDPAWTSPWSSLDDQQAIPKSIKCGSKPPKQVNVSKARERWEGGEPFARCKSRQRLAAQANKKLFPGTWSMTSVVATQQLHLKQALAQASAFVKSNIQDTDPSVKVLTRGSVLERVQQFERVPGLSDGNSPPVSTSYSSSSSSSSSLLSSSAASSLDGADDGSDQLLSDYLSRTSSASSLDAGANGEAVVTIGATGGGGGGTAADDSTGRKTHYKKRVSSIQQQQQFTPLLTSTVDSLGADQSAGRMSKSLSTSSVAQQRRLTLRRRSSLLSGVAQNNSTSSLIPRFYHPDGKPNTYEIEVQKRNIVAAFDNLPERSSQLEGPNAKRHFHQIATACGFSEYFKVPLRLYVKHQLDNCPQLFIVTQTKPSPPQRKTSTVSLPQPNGTSVTSISMKRRHSRSNSIALNQLNKPLLKAASVDSASNGTTDTACEIRLVSCDQFLACWRDLIGKAYDNAARFVHLLTLGKRPYLLPEDFVPLVQSIIDDHPGLSFLRAAPDFHMRYIQTVIARIYFCVNRSWTGRITLQELRKSNLLAVLQVLSQEDDINQITDYFSYEHFYVIYCKFWSLDQDHDLLISKEDLARHNDAAISSRIIERIFSNVVSKHTHKTGKMTYSDFVWFLIAEEDKKHPRSVEYWFRLMDIDGDGYISMYEMEYFYYEQMKRLELMNIEPLPFLDTACQILDLVNPKEKNKISLADLKQTKMSTIFFDTFINLEKYLEHESREFVSTRDVIQDGVVVSDWDRYAAEEYGSLVTEETSV